MFQLGQLEGRGLVLEHRHSDGTWRPLEPAPQHHDAAQHDPERGWEQGRIFKCAACDEEVRISSDAANPSDEG